jgi:hypothetical protein
MRHYGAFQLEPTGHVAGRIDLNCIDDEDAKRQAEMLASRRLWAPLSRWLAPLRQ